MVSDTKPILGQGTACQVAFLLMHLSGWPSCSAHFCCLTA